MSSVRHTSTRVKKMADDVESCVQLAFRKVCERLGIQKLNQQQEEAIRCIVLDNKDVFVNLPTGFGKSVIFQGLPEVFASLQPARERNIVIVVSPLVSLMKDQVSRLTSLGIRAICLGDKITESQRKAVENGQYLLFADRQKHGWAMKGCVKWSQATVTRSPYELWLLMKLI